MKGITTIAALPNGAGRAAHLAPEVGTAREPVDDPYAGYPALTGVVSPIIGESFDPWAGKKTAANRKELTLVTYEITGKVGREVMERMDAMFRACSGPVKAYRFSEEKGRKC